MTENTLQAGAPNQVMEGVWMAENATPSQIEAALRELLREHYEADQAFVPARVLNLVVVADREWRGEISNRLENVGRYHPSRTIFCAVEPGRTSLDAMAVMSAQGEGKGAHLEAADDGDIHLFHEEVMIDVGERHLPHLDAIVDPLVVTDLATVVWSPHGHQEAVDSLRRLAQVVLIDSIYDPDPADAIGRAAVLTGTAYVVDLAWLRSTPWRERLAASFDPPQWGRELGSISSVTMRHRPDSAIAGLLFFGWLASRLGWEPGVLIEQGGTLHGRCRGAREEVELRLEPDEAQSAPGLAGMTVETSSGMSLSLERGSGGLHARRRTRDGHDSDWTVMGASRGEAGILGEGIRQALLRDPTYQPALVAAAQMLG
ncbi:MAG: glucose-6-phosphate dehydrogenase assembly protein OpcA [Thermoleophilaceae bacterium]